MCNLAAVLALAVPADVKYKYLCKETDSSGRHQPKLCKIVRRKTCSINQSSGQLVCAPQTSQTQNDDKFADSVMNECA
jgi:hypothetical protein